MFKKCMKCGELVYVVNGNSNIICCNTEMKELVPNSVEATPEKHIPNVEVVNDKIRVSVNHVMDIDHYIGLIALEANNRITIRKLKPGIDAIVEFNYVDNYKIYSYCNKHGLWINKDVKDNT